MGLIRAAERRCRPAAARSRGGSSATRTPCCAALTSANWGPHADVSCCFAASAELRVSSALKDASMLRYSLSGFDHTARGGVRARKGARTCGAAAAPARANVAPRPAAPSFRAANMVKFLKVCFAGPARRRPSLGSARRRLRPAQAPQPWMGVQHSPSRPVGAQGAGAGRVCARQPGSGRLASCLRQHGGQHIRGSSCCICVHPAGEQRQLRISSMRPGGARAWPCQTPTAGAAAAMSSSRSLGGAAAGALGWRARCAGCAPQDRCACNMRPPPPPPFAGAKGGDPPCRPLRRQEGRHRQKL
jgi:hypothetical protein